MALKQLYSHEHPEIDIVAIHGMNPMSNIAHADNTWTDEESRTHWLRDEHMLPCSIPRARMLAFEYNANVFFNSSCADVQEQAKNLLNSLWLQREKTNSRPIIFIAHSLGGIIAKEALAKANESEGIYVGILTFTYGIACFGTPHRGSILASCGLTTRNSFLASVDRSSSFHRDLRERFNPLLEQYIYLNVCETLEKNISSLPVGVVVNPVSATLGLKDSKGICIYLNRDHKTVCKFKGEDDPDFRKVAANLQKMAKGAVDCTRNTRAVAEQEDEFRRMKSWYSDEVEEEPMDTLSAIRNANDVVGDAGSTSAESQLLSQLEVAAQNWGTIIWTLTSWNAEILNLLSWMFLTGFVLRIFIPTPSLPTRQEVCVKADEGVQACVSLHDIRRLQVEILDAQFYRTSRAVRRLEVATTVSVPCSACTAIGFPLKTLEIVRVLEEKLHKRKVILAVELHRRYGEQKDAKEKKEESEKLKKVNDERGWWWWCFH
ncbi:uncharacterized protein BDZ99DRAFT_466283 [Mytilinidion resinicola]|uniref:DUF676 domain-containing protein n=1 Tax=Mytilinidion resinicola TaxID=574789 RepID=A0A6A6YBN2_9PEZI|nr:uncharacterized protein BDZ99DRAFT_466283 [Mytilinidion resinicola]KAF2805988.1 hypothetical protein BDZ99DRAFT_466283 [Mytilinidion resinicola]